MTRLTTAAAVASIALVAVACSDSATGVLSSLRPTGSASAEAGNPPPPPFTGDGRGELDFEGGDNSFAVLSATAGASGPSLDQCGPLPTIEFDFTFKYLVNQPGSNGFLHLNPDDESRHVTIHQTDTKLDAHGVIAGPGFTFMITDATGGAGIFGSESRTSDVFEVDVTGVVTFADGSKCTTSATLSGTLFVPSDEIGLF